MDNSLEKLDNAYDGITYGRYNMPESYIKNHFKKGRSYEPGYFMSSSTSSRQADLVGLGGNVKITFEGYNGQSIEKISKFPSEKEVLFNADSAFEVEKVEKIDGVYHVILEEY